MSKPAFTIEGDKYLFEWEEEKLKAEVSRLIGQKDKISCNLYIATTDSECTPFIYNKRFTLTAPRAPAEVINVVRGRYRQKVNWDEILESICQNSLSAFEAGEPVRELWLDDKEIPAPRWLLKPIIMEGVPNVIFGEKGVHKTTFALLCALILALPWQENTLELEPGDASIHPLFLDWEQDEQKVQYYASLLRKGLGLPYMSLFYRHCDYPLSNDYESIAKYIAEKGVKCIIIDSMAAACGGELSKPEIALSFFAHLRKLKLTSLILAQQSKDPDTKKKSIFGSSMFNYYSRNVFELCKSETESISDYNIALFHHYGNYSQKLKPLGFNLHFNQNGIGVESAAVNIMEFKEKVSATLLILNALKQGLLTVEQLEDITGLTQGSLKGTLHRLKEKGKVVHPNERQWGLAAR